MANMLQLKNVTVSYKNVPTVQNFNLDMKQGQIVSLVGESGSGKTTVIRAVLGLLAGGGAGGPRLALLSAAVGSDSTRAVVLGIREKFSQKTG